MSYVHRMADLMRPAPPTPKDEAILVDLIQRGVLIGVELFATDDCCEHGMHEPCPADGFGLCDVDGPNSVGSDCNRAEHYLLRPSDSCMTDRVRHEINKPPASHEETTR